MLGQHLDGDGAVEAGPRVVPGSSDISSWNSSGGCGPCGSLRQVRSPFRCRRPLRRETLGFGDLLRGQRRRDGSAELQSSVSSPTSQVGSREGYPHIRSHEVPAGYPGPCRMPTQGLLAPPRRPAQPPAENTAPIPCRPAPLPGPRHTSHPSRFLAPAMPCSVASRYSWNASA